MGFLSRYQTGHSKWATATSSDSYLRVVNIYRLLELLDADTSAATSSAQGLMSSADKTSLNMLTATSASNIGKVWKVNDSGTPTWGTDNDTVYSHPTGDGNNHIPSGGSSGQILRWLSSGTATWGTDNDTVYSHPTGNGNNHIPSGGSSGQFLKWSSSGTATWAADNNTTYSNATTSVAGLMSTTDKSKLDNLSLSTLTGGMIIDLGYQIKHDDYIIPYGNLGHVTFVRVKWTEPSPGVHNRFIIGAGTGIDSMSIYAHVSDNSGYSGNYVYSHPLWSASDWLVADFGADPNAYGSYAAINAIILKGWNS